MKKYIVIFILAAVLLSGCGEKEITNTVYRSVIPRPYVDINEGYGDFIRFTDNPSENVYVEEIWYGRQVGTDRVKIIVNVTTNITIETKDGSRTVTANPSELWVRTHVHTDSGNTIFLNCVDDQLDKNNGFDFIRIIINGIVREQYYIADF